MIPLGLVVPALILMTFAPESALQVIESAMIASLDKPLSSMALAMMSWQAGQAPLTPTELLVIALMIPAMCVP